MRPAQGRHVAPAFEADHRVVLLDLPGMGGSDPASYDVERHGSLDGYADDLVGLIRELGLRDVVLVAHSVAAMMGVLAQVRRPSCSSGWCSSAHRRGTSTTGSYEGGFGHQDIVDLLDLMENNHLAGGAVGEALVMGDPHGRRT